MLDFRTMSVTVVRLPTVLAALAFGLAGCATEEALAPGDTFSDCENCPLMVVVDAGSNLVGAADDGVKFPSEVPRHEVTIAQLFAIGVYEVTFDEWDACVADGGCDGYMPDDRGWGRGRQPVINIHFCEAESYVAWLTAKTGHIYRFPTEAEWEYAARGGTTTPYSTGKSTITADEGNVLRVGPGQSAHAALLEVSSYGRTVPVGSYEPNLWGLYDVHGNVAEFTADCWNDTHEGAPADGSARTDGDCDERVLRGGSWVTAPNTTRSAFRSGVQGRDRRDQFVDQGFRVVRVDL